MDDTEGELRYLRRLLITLAVLAVLLLMWWARDALLMTFAAVLLALLLEATARPLQRWPGLPRGWALALAGCGMLLVLGLAGLLVGQSMTGQLGDLRGQLTGAGTALAKRLGIEDPASLVSGGLPSDVFSFIASFGSITVAAISALVLAAVGAAYLAAEPELYRRGIVALVPRSQHARAEDLLKTMANALEGWLLATLVAMLMIGVLVGLGAWAIGLPSPLALGLVAGLLEFVPVIGAILGALPALLLAISMGDGMVWWTLGLFLVVQQLEANMIMPLVQKRMVEVPPALLLFAVVAVGGVFGLAGTVVAAPLTVALYVAVKKLYVRQTLGEPTDVPGEKKKD